MFTEDKHTQANAYKTVEKRLKLFYFLIIIATQITTDSCCSHNPNTDGQRAQE